VVDTFRRAQSSELQGFDDGFVFEAPVISMATYMPWLLERFVALGGEVEDHEVRSLDAELRDAPVVVNCTGVDARELTCDADLHPIRGQVVIVARGAASRVVLVDEPDQTTNTTFIIPRNDCIVLGGTSEPGARNMDPDVATATAIRDRCVAIMPALADAPVLGHKVGLRPGRSVVRMEAERRAGGLVVHNYGHGGGGVTFSWSCAEEATRLVAQARALP
jgi:D-amino-acid oxidase